MAEIPSIIPALPELFLALVIMALLMLGVFHKTGTTKDDTTASRLISLLSVIALLLRCCWSRRFPAGGW